jgi:hypothetical protein
MREDSLLEPRALAIAFFLTFSREIPYLPPTDFVCGQNVMLSNAEYFSSQCMKQILSVKPKSIQIHDLDDRGKRGMYYYGVNRLALYYHQRGMVLVFRLIAKYRA